MNEERVTTERVQVLIKRRPGTEDVELPSYMSDEAAGMDVRAAVDENLVLEPGSIALVPAGFYMALPAGWEAQIRPRSGLALKHGVTVANTPGTIDADYRGEVGVILVNLGRESFTVTRGMRVAQMVIARAPQAEIRVVEELPQSDRGAGGFGSTGHRE